MCIFRTLAKMPFLSQLRLSPSTEETDDQGGAAGGDYDDPWWFERDHDFCDFDDDDFHDQGGAAGDHDANNCKDEHCDPCWLVAYIFEQKHKNIAYFYELSWI